jgi:hypothetical protein
VACGAPPLQPSGLQPPGASCCALLAFRHVARGALRGPRRRANCAARLARAVSPTRTPLYPVGAERRARRRGGAGSSRWASSSSKSAAGVGRSSSVGWRAARAELGGNPLGKRGAAAVEGAWRGSWRGSRVGGAWGRGGGRAQLVGRRAWSGRWRGRGARCGRWSAMSSRRGHVA